MNIVSPVAVSPSTQALRGFAERCLFHENLSNKFGFKAKESKLTTTFQTGIWNVLPNTLKEKGLLRTTERANQITHNFNLGNGHKKVFGLWTSNEKELKTLQQRRFKLFQFESSDERILEKAAQWSKHFSDLMSDLVQKAPYSYHSGENVKVLIDSFAENFRQITSSLGCPEKISLVDVIAKSDFSPVVADEKDQNIHFSRFGVEANRAGSLTNFGLESMRMSQEFFGKKDGNILSSFRMFEDFPGIYGLTQLPDSGNVSLHERHIISGDDLKSLKSGNNEGKFHIATGGENPMNVEVPFFLFLREGQAAMALEPSELENIFERIYTLDGRLQNSLADLSQVLRLVAPEKFSK